MNRHHTGIAHWLPALVLAGVLVFASDLPISRHFSGPHVIDGPYASLLAASTDLGPARPQQIQLTAALTDQQRPSELIDWTHDHGLSVSWRPSDNWAIVEGTPGCHSARLRCHRARLPRPAGGAAVLRVTATAGGARSAARRGRRTRTHPGYTPHHVSRPEIALDVPDRGLTPSALLTTYNADKLATAGFTGKGTTIVIFAFSGYDQKDLDSFSAMSGLPPVHPGDAR